MIETTDFAGRMPRIVTCGTRRRAFDSLRIAVGGEDAFPILFVDSEEPVDEDPWEHVKGGDGWDRLAGG